MSRLTPTCSSCNKNPAATFNKRDGRYLCRNCHSKWVIRTVKRTIKAKQMFTRDDRIIVGLSGGKDSSVLLHILSIIERKFPTELIAVCIDEGIANYREDGLPLAEQTAKKLDVEFHLFSFKELFGYSLDELVSRARELSQTVTISRDNRAIQQGACSFCGVFRRKALNIAARKLAGDKVATGHNLSDVSQTVLLNLLRGDSFKLMRGDLPSTPAHELFVPRVKPLQGVAERDVVLYAIFNLLEYHTTECPYAVEAMRLDVRNFLTEVEEQYPGSLHSIRNVMRELRNRCNFKGSLPGLALDSAEVHLCKLCQEPTSGSICKGCQILTLLYGEKQPLDD